MEQCMEIRAGKRLNDGQITPKFSYYTPKKLSRKDEF